MAFAGNIADISYDSIRRTLTVHFSSGGKYEYENVGYDKYSRLMEAPNRTEYFNEKLKDQFQFKKIY